MVKSLDRLERNYEDIQKEWRDIIKITKADIIIIDICHHQPVPDYDKKARKRFG